MRIQVLGRKTVLLWIIRVKWLVSLHYWHLPLYYFNFGPMMLIQTIYAMWKCFRKEWILPIMYLFNNIFFLIKKKYEKMTFLTISPNVAMDPAITVANPIFQSGIKQAMKNKSPLIGLFTNTGWKEKIIFQFGALAFTKVCFNDKCLWEKKESKNFFFVYLFAKKTRPNSTTK